MASAYRIELAAGDVLFREGDAPTAAFLIESGSLRITAERNGAPVTLSDLGPGALVGEMAVLDDSPRSATATALEACVLTPIDRAQFAERLQNADPVVRALLLSQLSRYRAALATFAGGAAPTVERSEEAPGQEAAFAIDKIRLENQLREALERHELEIRLQPILEIATGRIAGFEALTRWSHPERGAVSPADFIALAEETSLILPVGDYVLREVCSILRRFADASHGDLFIALNVSGRQLEDADFIERVLRQVREHAIAPAQLKLEITESLILDYAKVAALVDHSHRAGMRVALDDFGTGYSNLEHLHKLAFDTLKLDQGFVRQLDNRRCHAIVRAVVDMSRALGCDMVAEGVEAAQHLVELKELGCQYAQGYLVGKPQSVGEALASLEGVRVQV
ncbi:MAG TPA: EAL domain-containing protein [Casimicrobiaceae bacterium]|nr:EAL domain-containing protein [Casimicrobiaceae bacterium]